MKGTIIGVLGAMFFLGGAYFLVNSNVDEGGGSVEENVTVEDGRQIIEITAKGGYWPRNSVAKAGMPTTLRVETEGSFDCSSSLVIPDINYRGNLPITGSTDIELPEQKAGTILQGFCGMGMYNFSISFV